MVKLPQNLRTFSLAGAQLRLYTGSYKGYLCSPTLALLVYNVFQVPAIDSRSPLGLKPEKIDQVVELKNVHFAYPARPDVPVRL